MVLDKLAEYGLGGGKLPVVGNGGHWATPELERNAGKDIPGKLSWASANVTLSLSLFRPTELAIDLTGPQHIRIGDAQDAIITGEQIGVSVGLRQTNKLPLTLHAKNLRVEPADGSAVESTSSFLETPAHSVERVCLVRNRSPKGRSAFEGGPPVDPFPAGVFLSRGIPGWAGKLRRQPTPGSKQSPGNAEGAAARTLLLPDLRGW